MKTARFFLVLMVHTVLLLYSSLVYGQFSPQIAVDTDCHRADYPNLELIKEESLPSYNGDKFIYHTVPFKKVLAFNSYTYRITHPVPGNECSEMTTDIVTTDERIIDGMQNLKKVTRKHPRKSGCCMVTIKRSASDDKGIWKIYATIFPTEKKKSKETASVPTIDF